VSEQNRKKKPLELALWYLGRRAHSRREIEEKLTRKGFGAEEATAVVNKLEGWRLLDDREFARQFTRSGSLRGWGRRRIAFELTRRGVAKEIIEIVLAEALDEETEEKALSRRLQIYWKRIADLPREKQYNRAMGYLLRRGFPLDEVKKAVNGVINAKCKSRRLAGGEGWCGQPQNDSSKF